MQRERNAYHLMEFQSSSPKQTQEIAQTLGRLLRAGDCIAAEGQLGAGKTCFAQGLAKGLAIDAVVSSPSFVLAKTYPGTPGFLHVDAYRLGSPMEFWDLGLTEQMDESVTLIEWAGNVMDALPDDCLGLAIERVSDQERVLRFSGSAGRWQSVLDSLRAALAQLACPESDS